MLITLDTEFIDDGHTIELLSIALVDQDGEEFYAVVEDADWERAVAIDWIRDNVVAKTPLLDDGGWTFDWDTEHPDIAHVMQRRLVQDGVREFLQERGGPDDVDLWAYYPATDHVALYQLFGPMIECTQHGVPMRTSCLKQEEEMRGRRLALSGKDFARLASALAGPRPVQEEATEHHALFDARHDMDLARWLGLVN